MPIWVGGSAPTNIYVGTTAVQKVYCGTQLVWSKTAVTGTFGKATHTYTFGNNGNGNQYYLYFEVYVSSKNYVANTMVVTVDTYLGSIGNYNIVASTARTATITIDGNERTTASYTATTNAGTKKQIGNNGATLTGKHGTTITIKASVPLKVTIDDGVGYVDTPSCSFSYTLPNY